MQVEITITDDNGDVTTTRARLSRWKGMPPELRLLSVVVGRPLADTYLICVSAGIDVLVQEYARTNLKMRKAELRMFVEGG